MNAKAPWRIEWTDELSVGIPEIDDEHRRFIDLLNSFNAAIRERATVNTLETMMENAIADIRDHFRHEEQLFEQYDYEGRDEHAQLHAQAIGRLDDMSAAFKASISDSERIQMGLDIKNLLVSHLLDEDMKYRGMQKTHPGAGDE